MYTLDTGLTSAKKTELARALTEAAPEIVGANLALKAQIHPLTMEHGLSLPVSAPPIGQANLTILQHQDSGCIQFAFPVQSGQPVPQLTPQTPDFAFGFIRPRQLADGVDLGGMLRWNVKAALNVLKDSVTLQVVEAIEAHAKPEGLISIADGYQKLATPEQLAQAQNQRVLLFVHGIFSSTEGAFNDLSGNGATTMGQLLAHYNKRVFGYDHWTVAKTPQQNAVDLLNAIPSGANWDVDIVCHSRGGLVVRSLLSVLNAGAQPATAELQQIAALRQGRIRSVGTAVFVAAANQGSQLADPDDIRNFLNVAAMLASGSAGMALDVVIGLAKYVVSAGFALPSIEALATGSPLISDLNAGGTLLKAGLSYFAHADFDYGKSTLKNVGVFLDKYLMKVDNDLVVPYDGLAMPEFAALDNHWLNFGTPGAKQGTVWHTEFFGQEQTQTFLRNCLL